MNCDAVPFYALAAHLAGGKRADRVAQRSGRNPKARAAAIPASTLLTP